MRLALFLLTTHATCAADFTHAIVSTPANLAGPEREAAALLVDAIAEHTRITLPIGVVVPSRPAISIRNSHSGPAEGYTVRSSGNDERGMRRHKTRLPANGTLEIHPTQKGQPSYAPLKYEIPWQATEGGALTLERHPNPEDSGNGRYVQLCEVWRIHEK
jgi:hypothetical protein